MAGGTHILDMIKQLRNNENLRKMKYFRKSVDGSSNRREGVADSANVLSENEKADLIRKIRRQQTLEQKKKLIALFISFLFVVIVVVLFVVFVRF